MSGPLPAGAIEHFRRFGYIRLRQAFRVGEGTLAQRWLELAEHRVGAQDLSGPVSLPPTRLVEIEKVAPQVWAAMGQLVGGVERLRTPAHWSDAFLVQDAWEEPARDIAWHVDGDFFRHFLDSPEQALLVFVLWTDVKPESGPTRIVPESIGAVSRFLAQHPEGVEQMEIPAREIAERSSKVVDVLGDAGDVWLLHPFMVHGSLPCSGRAPRRVISNPVARRVDPLQLDDGAPAPVEQAILDALGAERLSFSPTRERRIHIPSRVEAWQRDS